MAKKSSQLIGLSTDARVELYLIRMAFEDLKRGRVVEMRDGMGGRRDGMGVFSVREWRNLHG